MENIWKASNIWAWFSRILGQEGEEPWTSGPFNNVVVQVNLLFGLETWAMVPRIGRTLRGFHRRVDCRLVVMQPMQDMSGRRERLTLEASMADVGIGEVETYVLCRQNTTAQYITTRSILDICLVAEWRPGSRVSQQWWYQ